MKKLLILTGVVLTLIVIYPKETWEIFRKVEAIVSNHFSTETVKPDDLIERNDLYYKKHTDIPFTGKVESYHKNGQLDYKRHYKDGKKDGPWVVFNKDGTKRFTPHKEGLDEGSGTYRYGKKISD